MRMATSTQHLRPDNLRTQTGVWVSAGLISQERSGRNLIYRVEFDQMNGLLAYLTENCCQGAEACLNASATHCPC